MRRPKPRRRQASAAGRPRAEKRSSTCAPRPGPPPRVRTQGSAPTGFPTSSTRRVLTPRRWHPPNTLSRPAAVAQRCSTGSQCDLCSPRLVPPFSHIPPEGITEQEEVCPTGERDSTDEATIASHRHDIRGCDRATYGV